MWGPQLYVPGGVRNGQRRMQGLESTVLVMRILTQAFSFPGGFKGVYMSRQEGGACFI